MSGPSVVVTRPSHDAPAWVLPLESAGFRVLQLPLLTIAEMPDSTQLHGVWQRLTDFAAVMFVSGNAVSNFFRASPASGPWPGVQAWCTGPGTQRALEAAGVPKALIAAPDAHSGQFDSESLWRIVLPQVRAWIGAQRRVLVVRGADAQGQTSGRDWLTGQMHAAGLVTETIAVYRRLPPQWTPAQREQAEQALRDGSVWLLTSSEAVAQLAACVPLAEWSRAHALASHPRIAQAARDLGFGHVETTRPELSSVIASINSSA